VTGCVYWRIPKTGEISRGKKKPGKDLEGSPGFSLSPRVSATGDVRIMQNIFRECKRRIELVLLQRRISRLTNHLIREATQVLDPLPLAELRQIEQIRLNLIRQRNALRTSAEISRIEKRRGLA
jgi:hypothetical protein